MHFSIGQCLPSSPSRCPFPPLTCLLAAGQAQSPWYPILRYPLTFPAPGVRIVVLSDPVWSSSLTDSLSLSSLPGWLFSASQQPSVGVGASPMRSGVSWWSCYALFIFNPSPPSAPLPGIGVELCKHYFDLACTLGNTCISIRILFLVEGFTSQISFKDQELFSNNNFFVYEYTHRHTHLGFGRAYGNSLQSCSVSTFYGKTNDTGIWSGEEIHPNFVWRSFKKTWLIWKPKHFSY